MSRDTDTVATSIAFDILTDIVALGPHAGSSAKQSELLVILQGLADIDPAELTMTPTTNPHYGFWNRFRVDPILDDDDEVRGLPAQYVWPWANAARSRRSVGKDRRRIVLDHLRHVARDGCSPAEFTASDGKTCLTIALVELAPKFEHLADGSGAFYTDHSPAIHTFLTLLQGGNDFTSADNVFTSEFVATWWEYLDMRWRQYGECPDAATQMATLLQLSMWFNPVGCVQQAIVTCSKGVYPLREHLDGKDMYRELGVLLKTKREWRSVDQDNNFRSVRDTVAAYLPTRTHEEQIRHSAIKLAAERMHAETDSSTVVP